jgi:PAS domain S-box-containing protein
MIEKNENKQAGNSIIPDIIKLSVTGTNNPSNFYHTLLNTIPCPIFFKDANGIYRDCNKAFAEKILGLPKQELIGKTLFQFPEKIPLKLAEKYHQADNELFRNGVNQTYESAVKCADGLIRYFCFYKSVLKDPKGAITGLVGVMLDISDKVKYSRKLRESEERLQKLQKASFGAIVIHDHGIVLDANEQFYQLSGYSEEEIKGKNGLFTISPATIDKVKNNIKNNIEFPYEAEIISKDGTVIPIMLQAKAILYNGKTVRVTEMRDISAQKAAEKAHKVVSSKYETIFSNCSAGIMHLTPTRVVQNLNSRFCEIIGFSPEELLGQSIEKIHHSHESFVDFGEKYYNKINAGETIKTELSTINHRTHKELCLKITGKMLDPQQPEEGSIWIIEDITKAKILEKRKEELLHDFESIFENSTIGIMLLKEDRLISRINQKALKILGYNRAEELIGHSVKQLHVSDKAFEQFALTHFPLLLEGKEIQVEIQLKRKNGQVFWGKAYGKAFDPKHMSHGLLWLFEDIDEKKKLEEEKEKLTSELQEATQNIKNLKGLLPICAGCKKIKDDKGEWEHIESYIKQRSDTEFSHGLCPNCAKELYGDEDWFDEEEFKE